MEPVPLTVAVTCCDHLYPVISGEVEIAGAAPRFTELAAPLAPDDAGDLDIAEVSLVRYLAGSHDLLALPVFPSRRFPHGCVYVREPVVDLRTARIAVTEPDADVSVYARGMLADRYGAATWVRPDEDPDVVVAPEPVAGMTPLFDEQAEQEYFEKTKVFPITSVLAVRRDVLARHRWLASNIYRSFEIARRRYFARLTDIKASRVPIPSAATYASFLRDVLGPDIWPYGLAANQTTLEMALSYAGVTAEVADLFAPAEPYVDGM
jgi:4,5-dihydroxyphthalate decarboxylase